MTGRQTTGLSAGGVLMMEQKRSCRKSLCALAAGALLATAGSVTAGEVTFFSQRDFAGEAMTVRGAAPKLDRIGFNDTASSLVIRDGVWEVCTDAYFRGRCTELQPGEYSSLGVGTNERIASAREIAPSALPVMTTAAAPPPVITTTPAAPPPLVTLPADSPRIVLYENSGFNGRSVELTTSVGNLDRVRFGDRADSAIVLNGVWRLCEDVRGRGECIEIGPGRYDTLGALTNRVGFAEIVATATSVPAVRTDGRVVLYQLPNFRGHSIVVEGPALPRLTAAYFGNGAASMRIESGQWMFCRNAYYAGECRTFGPGSYAQLPWELDHVASGRQLAERYSLLR
jgi:Beta/Gamma crystallin